MHVDELRSALKHFGKRAIELSDKLDTRGRELTADEKKLARMVEVNIVSDRMDEALWLLWRGHEEDYRKSLDNIAGAGDGLW